MKKYRTVLDLQNILEIRDKYFKDLPNLFCFYLTSINMDQLLLYKLVSRLMFEKDVDDNGSMILRMLEEEIYIGKPVTKLKIKINQFIKRAKDIGYTLACIMFYQTDEICIEAVRKNGASVGYVDPLNCLNYEEICRTAFQQSGLFLRCIVNQEISREDYINICMMALKQDVAALQHVDRNRVTPKDYTEMCKVTVERNGLALEHVYPGYITPRENYPLICTLAIKQNPRAAKFIFMQ